MNLSDGIRSDGRHRERLEGGENGALKERTIPA
jgi:hypothetical protein